MSMRSGKTWASLGLWFIFILLAVFVFRSFLGHAFYLFTTDDNIGELVQRKNGLPHSWLGWWSDSPLLGMGGSVQVNLTYLLMYALPILVFNNWFHAICLVLAAGFLALYLRDRGLRLEASLLGGLAYAWLGSNLTLTYAGHISKFAVLVLAAFCLWSTDRAVRRASWAWASLAGGAMGAMFLEQQDVALFFALVLGPYALFALLRDHGLHPRPWLKVLPALLIVCALMALRPVLDGYRLNVQGVASLSEENPKAQWAFATQWSWPPDETIDFIAPGYMGWRSGEPKGPYWGRMGRSDGWEQTRQGFMNFKLENTYLGAIPILFALFALLTAFRQPGRDEFSTGYWRRPPAQLDCWFWGAATVLTLLLAFGKYFPLYRIFFQLPLVDSIRNPNKFLQVFQLGLGVLAAYGLHQALSTASPSPPAAKGKVPAAPTRLPAPTRWFLGGAALLGGLMLICSMALAASGTAAQDLVRQGWGQYAYTIVSNRIQALAHGGILTLLAVVGLVYLLSPRVASTRAKIRVAWLLVVLAAGDALLLSRHYIQTMPRASLEANDVIRLLKTSSPPHRVALVSQDGFYNHWLTYLFPYHGIKAVNVTQMPRMQEDYQAFLKAVGSNPLRLWELAAVEYVLGPSSLWRQLSTMPDMKDRFELALAFQVVPQNGGYAVLPGRADSPDAHVVLRLKHPAPRFALVPGWREVEDAEALRQIANPAFQPLSTVLLAPDAVKGLPALDGSAPAGEVTCVAYRQGSMKVETKAGQPSLLLVSEKHDPAWRAWVDGKPEPVRRAHYLLQALYLPAGNHEVVLRYAPDNRSLWVQGAAGAGCLIALLAILLGRKPGKLATY